MTSNDVTPPKHIAHDHAWQTLIEFTLPGEFDSEHLVTDQVAEAAQRLDWPATLLDQLKLALTKATRNALERSYLSHSRMSLLIRVLIPKGSEAIQPADQPSDKSSQPQISEGMVQQASRSPSRGWGFFLVQKQEDDPQALAGESHYLIELFLYHEKERSSKK